MASVQQGYTLQERLKDPSYKNWLKAGICLSHVKDGLKIFAETESKILHLEILAKYKPCGHCTQDGVKQRKKEQLCPNCNSFKAEIVRKHKYKSPNWDNTDVQKWPDDHWTVSKCFMNSGQFGYDTPSVTDISGLLSFIIQCEIFQDPKYGNIQNNAENVRDNRNHFVHSGRDQLSHAQLLSCTKNMLKLLMDENPAGQLKGNKEAEKAKAQIQEVMETNFLILLEDEYKVRSTALEGRIDMIESKLQEFKTGVTNEKISEEVMVELKRKYEQLQQMLNKIQEDQNAVHRLQAGLNVCDTLIQNLDERVKSRVSSITQENVQLKQSLHEMQIQLDEVKSKVEQQDFQHRDHDSKFRDQKSQFRNYEEIDDMRKDLKSCYKSLSTIPFSPFDEKKTVSLQEFYIDVIIEHQAEQKHAMSNNMVENSRDRNKEKLYSYKQIFVAKRNERIILTGLSGSGKTTFCRKIVNAWCMEESSKDNETIEGTDPSIPVSPKAMSDEKETEAIRDVKPDLPIVDDSQVAEHDCSDLHGSEAIADKDVLLQFSLLFYIYAPKISCEETLTKVIYNQCLKRESNQLSKFLHEHPEKILVILDGMDEMGDEIPPFLSDLLGRTLHPRVIVLMAMRPWKISQLKLEPLSHCDLYLEVQGLSENNAMKFVQKVINQSKKYMTIEGPGLTPEEKKVLSSFKNTPLLLLFLTHTWCQDHCLPNRKGDLYTKILECLIKRCLNKTGNKYTYALRHKNDMKEFLDLCLKSASKAAYHFLLKGVSGPSVVMQEKDLMDKLGSNAELKVNALLDCGILSKKDDFSPLEKNVSITFLHLSIHEYLTARHLVNNENAFQKFLVSLKTLNDVLRYENLFIFICGFDAKKGHDAFIRICEVCDEDPLVIQYRQSDVKLISSVENLNEMYRACLNEIDSQEIIQMPDVRVNNDGKWYNIVISRLFSCFVKSLDLERMTVGILDLKSLTNLTSLKLWNVNMSEECSRSFCGSISILNHLERLELWNITLHDGVLDLGRMTNLTVFSLGFLTMSEECLRSLGTNINVCNRLGYLEQMTDLTLTPLLYLTMSDACSISLCSSINNCTHLKSLVLFYITLYNGVLDLKNLTNLTSLVLNNVTMSEECSRSMCSGISMSTHLESLKLQNIILHDGVLDLKNLIHLKVLDFQDVTLSHQCRQTLKKSVEFCEKLEKCHF